MEALVSPSTLTGIYRAPASKSAMQRACAAALLRGGVTVLQNPGVSDDDRAALGIIRQLGAQVTEIDGTIRIESAGVQPVGGALHCGESGLSVRMFTPLAALSAEEVTITGAGSLVRRPLDFFDTVLPQLGVSCHSNDGLLPLKVRGPLQPRDVTVDGSLSSQFLTGLLMAYSAAAARNVTVQVEGLNSKPYIDLTLQVLQDFGLKVPRNEQYERFVYDDRDQPPATNELSYPVEGDWSGASFLLVAAALFGSLEIRGLDVFSPQADKAVLQPLMQCGAIMSVRTDAIEVRSGKKLDAFHFNATDCPDLFPPLVALAAYCHGTSVIEGVSRLAHKESNRALTLQEEFGKMGLTIELQDDLMIIRGGGGLKGATVSSRHDHRIAMATAVAALGADGPTTITGAEAVGKSYPDFWRHLQQLGATLSLTDNPRA
ncbi:3-phosphoshikimate 1-carboxyvinyltransferase [Flaviaesturariibacter amylovorans]|uniref:3-phosphoshikimate 1-carboxyvinyltransferase n=1 Tax=Flaviaesturariibacter amylovorans TaxID=1084520 RepID=A0ABP8H2L7_9BACT